jgi:LEA14-like dessication related protein
MYSKCEETKKRVQNLIEVLARELKREERATIRVELRAKMKVSGIEKRRVNSRGDS